MKTASRSLLISLCFILLLAFIPVCYAQDFRVDNELRVEGTEKPIKSTTYFLGPDFLARMDQNGEITYFDSTRKLFTLVNPVLRIQTRLDGNDMIESVRRWKETPDENRSPLALFVVKPDFRSEYDPASGQWALQSNWFEYRLLTIGFVNERIGQQYLDFCDWGCYLNFRIHPQSPAPLVRLEVNRLLKEKKRFPKQIQMSYYPKGNRFLAKAEKTEATHSIVTRLDDTDQQRISEAKEFMRAFPMVTFPEYQKQTETLPAQ